MQSEKPCCPATAPRTIKKLDLPGGLQVGMANLENILKEVADLKPVDDETIKTELLKRAKVYNYVAPRAEIDYCEALLREYKKPLWRRV